MLNYLICVPQVTNLTMFERSSLFVGLLLSSFFTTKTEGTIAMCGPCLSELCPEALLLCDDLCAQVYIWFPPAYDLCIVACAAVGCLPCVPACACYDQNTTVTLPDGRVSSMALLQHGDQVQTLDDNFQLVNTTVTSIALFDGNFDAVKIQTSSASITLTDQHLLPVFRAENDFRIINASSVSIGDLMMQPSGVSAVVGISDAEITTKIGIVTETCNILADGILTTTC